MDIVLVVEGFNRSVNHYFIHIVLYSLLLHLFYSYIVTTLYFNFQLFLALVFFQPFLNILEFCKVEVTLLSPIGKNVS